MIENPYMILFVFKNFVHAINEKYLSDITSKCILYQNRYILYFIGFKGLIKRPTLEYPYSPHAVNRTLAVTSVWILPINSFRHFTKMAKRIII